MKKIISVIFTIVIILLMSITSFAAKNTTEGKKYVVDTADILTDQEEEDLTNYIIKAVQNCKMDIVVVTITSSGAKTLMEYADDYYDYNGFHKNGALLLVRVNPDKTYNRGNSWISTSGRAIKAITDDNIQTIGANITPNLIDGNYLLAFTRYVTSAESLMKKGVAIDYKNMAVWAVIVGVIVTIIVNNILKGQLKSVKSAADASNYVVDGSVAIARSYDHFLYSNVVSSRRQTSSSSSGSSTHTSSSGNTHGGGGF